MKGYKLTSKGIFTLTLVFLAFFAVMTTGLTLWAGRLAGPPELPDDVVSSGVPVEPSVNPPVSTGYLSSPGPIAVPSAPSSDVSPGTTPDGQGTVSPGTPPVSQGPSAEPPSTGDPVATDPPVGGGDSWPDTYMQITFPQGAAVLTTDSHAALEAYLASLPSADLDSIALLIDGRAHTDEGGDKEALRVLAEARGAAVAAICVAWGLPADNIATFVSWGEETAPEVLGAYLHFYHRGEK